MKTLYSITGREQDVRILTSLTEVREEVVAFSGTGPEACWISADPLSNLNQRDGKLKIRQLDGCGVFEHNIVVIQRHDVNI